jgi:hypothetical protein
MSFACFYWRAVFLFQVLQKPAMDGWKVQLASLRKKWDQQME